MSHPRGRRQRPALRPALRPPLGRVLAASVLALVPVLAGCSSLGSTGDLDYVAGDGQIVEYDAADRLDPVDLSGETVDGGTWDIADHEGQVVVVNVWWSLCGPCITEMPMLTALESAYTDLGDEVTFVGINVRDSSVDLAAAFERDRGVEYPSIYDPAGKALLSFPGRTAPRSMPTTLVLDTEGRVASIVSGPVPSAITLASLVETAGGPEASEVDVSSAAEAEDEASDEASATASQGAGSDG
ncbi:TlpA disulfide reductase family protein [Nocardioides bruguierae]|uniref:TlpA disulfide reductase family protein n=1 Tax=Nocardioides bruguierae TaxID=2945102 RepID=UPI0020220F0F|nr:TlpA disulfide reductase family protein [Nocardioides bruguierae]MCL8023825.1 TlpA family protein disulfide reductase [Nocardioides bruguierae]